MIRIVTRERGFYVQVMAVLKDAMYEAEWTLPDGDLDGAVLFITDRVTDRMLKEDVPIFLISEEAPGWYEETLEHRFYKRGEFDSERLRKDVEEWCEIIFQVTEMGEKICRYENQKERQTRIVRDYEDSLQRGGEIWSSVCEKSESGSLDIAVAKEAHRVVSGDLFLCKDVENGTYFFLGDVTNHGYDAGMIGVGLRVAFEDYFWYEKEPSLSGLTEELHRAASVLSSSAGIYSAASVLGFYDKEGRKLRLLICGGEYPVLLPRGGSPALLEALEDYTRPPIGDPCFLDAGEYRIATFPFFPGDGLLCFTDGVTEIFRNAARKDVVNCYSAKRVRNSAEAIVRRDAAWTAGKVVSGVLNDAESFGIRSSVVDKDEVSKIHKADDYMVVCLKVKGAGL